MPPHSHDVTLAFAWYRRGQWARLRELASDREQLAATYDGWLRAAEGHWRDLEARGLPVRKVDVDVELLWAWCCAHGRELDGAARAEYAADSSRRSDAVRAQPGFDARASEA